MSDTVITRILTRTNGCVVLHISYNGDVGVDLVAETTAEKFVADWGRFISDKDSAVIVDGMRIEKVDDDVIISTGEKLCVRVSMQQFRSALEMIQTQIDILSARLGAA